MVVLFLLGRLVTIFTSVSPSWGCEFFGAIFSNTLKFSWRVIILSSTDFETNWYHALFLLHMNE